MSSILSINRTYVLKRVDPNACSCYSNTRTNVWSVIQMTNYRYVTMMRFTILTMVITIFACSGALLHAYASDNKSASTSLDAGSLTAYQAEVQEIVTIDVCAGDTLWDIASSHLPEGKSIRSYMNQIKKANHMKTSDIQEGQLLILP